MTQFVGVRSLSRTSRIRLIDKDGNKVTLSSTADTVVDLDRVDNRKALAHHSTVGQWIVSAANASTGAGVALPADT